MKVLKNGRIVEYADEKLANKLLEQYPNHYKPYTAVSVPDNSGDLDPVTFTEEMLLKKTEEELRGILAEMGVSAAANAKKETLIKKILGA